MLFIENIEKWKEREKESLCYNSKLTAINIYSQFKSGIYLPFSTYSHTRCYGE